MSSSSGPGTVECLCATPVCWTTALAKNRNSFLPRFHLGRTEFHPGSISLLQMMLDSVHIGLRGDIPRAALWPRRALDLDMLGTSGTHEDLEETVRSQSAFGAARVNR